MNSQSAINKIVDLLIRHLEVDDNEARYVAQKIYADIVAVSVENERNSWILMSTSAPDMPDPERGHDC